MADVFRAQTCVMVTSPGFATSHPNNVLPQRKGIIGQGGLKGKELVKVKTDIQFNAVVTEIHNFILQHSSLC